MKTRVRLALAKTVATLPLFSLCYRRAQPHQKRRGKLYLILSMQHAVRPVVCAHDTLLKGEVFLQYVYARLKNMTGILYMYICVLVITEICTSYMYICIPRLLLCLCRTRFEDSYYERSKQKLSHSERGLS